MTEKTYTYNDVKLWAVGAVEMAGSDYVYSSSDGCLYAHGDIVDGYVPGCLIGHMLVSNTGITLEELSEFDGLGQISTSIGVIHQQLPVKFTTRAVEYMSAIQTRQDTGTPWGECITVSAGTDDIYDRYENYISDDVRIYGYDV